MQSYENSRPKNKGELSKLRIYLYFFFKAVILMNFFIVSLSSMILVMMKLQLFTGVSRQTSEVNLCLVFSNILILFAIEL
ncbi:hypothetical protein GLOIN_2v1721409 [Rhizophagus irregularis DAOM 181602=DAOM 197198]|nr:hypothetical protein GLOIN_2v1721409 [Rhizophagus irregularis DAOM 181602=DAOM 197198]